MEPDHFALYSCSRTHQAPNHSAPGIRMGNCHFRFLMSGHGWYYDGHDQHELFGGMVLALDGNAKGHVVCDADNPYDFYFINFNGRLARHIADRIISQNGILFPYDDTSPIISLCERIYGLPLSEGRHFNLADALCSELLMHLVGDEAAPNPSVTFEKIVRYLESHLSSAINRDHAAHYFNVHPLTLDRICKQAHGQTLRQVHENMRISLAQSLLSNKHARIQEIAARIGYEDPFHFSRVFKKHCGISPKQFQLGPRAPSLAKRTNQ